MADVDLTAELDRIAERWSKVAYVGLKPEVVPEPGHQPPWLPDVPRLLSAAAAALRLVDQWDAESDERDDLAAAKGTDEEAAPILRGEAIAYHDCAAELRAAITREIRGKGESDA